MNIKESVGEMPAARPEKLKQVLTRFESIGDNCEFGFVQRANGIEPGGLLRWTTTPLPRLITLLSGDFKDFYLFENLIPNPDDGGMVIDAVSGIGFHSRLRSRDGKFLLNDDDRRLLYAEEKVKIDYLVEKLLARMADSSVIFVYKATWGAREEDIKELHSILRRHSNCRLLFVAKPPKGGEAGMVEDKGGGLLTACASDFAPWDKVDAEHIDVSGWEDIALKALSMTSS